MFWFGSHRSLSHTSATDSLFPLHFHPVRESLRMCKPQTVQDHDSIPLAAFTVQFNASICMQSALRHAIY
jgi:hypothetical protein